MRLLCAAFVAVLVQDVSVLDLTVDGPAGRLHLSDGGAGRDLPIIFIPSLAGTVRQWSAQLSHVRRTRRAVALEPRGHGGSEPPRDRDYSMERMAADVDAVLTALRIRRVIVAAHSMGGGVALAYAAAHPQQVAGVFLVDPIDDPSQRPPDAMTSFLRRLDSPDYAAEIEGYWMQILEGAAPGVKDAVVDDLRRTPRETVIGAMLAMGRFNASAALQRYDGPVMSVITRFNDVPSSLHRVAPSRVRHVAIAGTSHWIQMDKPDELNRLLEQFVAGLKSP
jgi:pimeloyl-ACP methyl ester carboxylesterase